MNVYKEKTNDHRMACHRRASDNKATYILTSSIAHDLYYDYIDKYSRIPSSKWYNRHFIFEKID